MEGLTSRESYRLWLLKHELVYRNEADALADAHRLALLTAVKGAREDRERLRVSTVNSLNLARDPAARRVRGGSNAIDVLFIGAIVLAVVSVALTFVTAMGGMFAGGGGVAILFGLLALASVVAFAWCDPYRARGEVYYSGTSSTLYLVLAVLWLAVFGFGVIAGRSDVNAYTMPFVVAGGALFVGSAGWALWLWWRGRHDSDLAMLPLTPMTEPPEGLLRRLDAGRGLLDRADEPALYAVLDEWWRRTAADADLARPGRIEQVWRIVVQKQLQQPGVQPKEQKTLERALKSGMRATWEERRYDWSPR